MHAVAVSLLEQETRGEHLLGMSRHVQLLSGTVRDSAAFKHIPSTRGHCDLVQGRPPIQTRASCSVLAPREWFSSPLPPWPTQQTPHVCRQGTCFGRSPRLLRAQGLSRAAVGKVDRIQRAEAEALAGAQGQHSKQLPGPLPWCLGQVVATGQMLPRMTTSSLSGSVGQCVAPDAVHHCYLTCVVPFAEGPPLCAEEMQDMP